MHQVRTYVSHGSTCPVCQAKASISIRLSGGPLAAVCANCRFEGRIRDYSRERNAYELSSQFVAVVVSRAPRKVWDYDFYTGVATPARNTAKRIPIAVGSYATAAAAEAAAIAEATHRFMLGGCSTAAVLTLDKAGRKSLRSSTVTGKVVSL